MGKDFAEGKGRSETKRKEFNDAEKGEGG